MYGVGGGMEPVGSWYGYSRVGEEGGSQLLPLAPPPGAFPPPPPPVYDLAPLFTQKAPHYGGLRKTSDDPQREQYHPQPPTSGFFDQSGNTAWSQGGQLPSPFGILPHESVVPDSPKTYDNFNHFAQSLSSFADPKKRTQSPPVKAPTPAAFFQQSFGEADVNYGPVGGGPKTGFINGGVSPQGSCVATTTTGVPNKEYRIPQPPPRTQYNKPRNFTPQVATAVAPKPVVGRDRRSEAESQSSPISFAMMDAQRGFKPRPQFPTVQQNFRFAPPEVRSENFINGECARRPQHSASPVYPPMYSSPPQHDSCYNKPNPEPPPLDVTLPRTPVAAYSSVITRTAEKNFAENRFGQGQWGDAGRNDQNGVERQQYYENNHHQNLQDLSSCRGDPMSLVKTLQQDSNGKIEDKSKKRRKSAEKPPSHHQDEYYPRVPPPAHHNQPGQNGYLEFERWNLPPPPPPPGKVFPTSPVAFSGQPGSNFVSNHQTALMVPAPPLSYFPPFHLTQPTPPETANTNPVVKPTETRPKVVVPNIEEELDFLADASDIELPVKPLAPNPNAGFMSSFIKFLQGEKEASPPPIPQPRLRPQPLPLPPPIPPPGEFPGDPQDDPRYFPLPKSSDSRVFDSSEDSDCSDETSRGFRSKAKTELPVVQPPTPSSNSNPPPPLDKVVLTPPVKTAKLSPKPRPGPKSKKKKPPPEVDPLEIRTPPRRETSKRKAKEKPLPREDGVEEETVTELNDSDSDPAWIPQPLEVMQKQHPGNVGEDPEEKKKKKAKKVTPKKKQKTKTKEVSDDEDDVPLLLRAQFEKTGKTSIKKKKSPPKKNNKNNFKSDPRKNLENNKSNLTAESNKCPFKTNSFVLLSSDFYKWNPSLWRIRPKGILQRYDPIIKDGVTLYVNFSLFSSWSNKDDNMTKAKEIEVKILGHNRSEIVVQPISYVIQEPSPSNTVFVEACIRETSKYQDHFEVYIQTLFSQALDANFLMEIFHEKDDYFLNNVRAIDSVTESYAVRLWETMGWSGDDGLGAVLKQRPCLARTECVGSGKCSGCSKAEASKKLSLSGEPYHSETLRPISESSTTVVRELKLCSTCCERAELGHRLLHQKCGLFSVCLEAVRSKRAACPGEDTTAILNQLLADEPWTNKIFREVRMTWAFVEKQIREAKGSH